MFFIRNEYNFVIWVNNNLCLFNSLPFSPGYFSKIITIKHIFRFNSKNENRPTISGGLLRKEPDNSCPIWKTF